MRENAPTGQYAHEDRPIDAPNMPAAHGVDAVKPCALQYTPSAQGMHVAVMPEPVYTVPTGHSVQRLANEMLPALHKTDVGVGGGLTEQEVAPALANVVFVEQRSHTVNPITFAYESMLQS